MYRIISMFKYAFKGMVDNKFIVFLLILQLVVSITLLDSIIKANENIRYNAQKIMKQYNVEEVFQIKVNENSENFLKNRIKNKSLAELQSIKNDVKNIFNQPDMFERLMCDFSYIQLPYNQFSDQLGLERKTIKAENIKGEFKQLDVTIADCYIINETYLNKFGLDIENGRLFNESDYKTEPIVENLPIIIGNNLAKYYKIGDVISIYNIYIDNEIYYEVVGVLKKDATIFMHEYEYSDFKRDVNNIIIIPNTESEVYQNAYKEYALAMQIELPKENESIYSEILEIVQGMFVINNNYSLEEIKIYINSKLEDLGLYKVDVITMNERFDLQKESIQKNLIQDQIMFIGLFGVTFIGIVITFVSLISRKTKEYGIHILNGATKFDICERVFFEIFIIYIIAISIVVIKQNILELINYYKSLSIANVSIIFNLSLPSLGLIIGIIILAVISAIIPMIKLRKMDINDIVKGDE